MEHVHNINGDAAELRLKGRFTFADNRIFSRVLDEVTHNQCRTLVIDLEGVEFIDSAALGILLLAREKCGKADINLMLRNPMGQVQQMFQISKFDALFSIDQRASA